MTTTAIEKARPPVEVTDFGVRFDSIESLFRFSEAVHRSALAPRSLDTPEKILVAIETGLELGLRPMQALRGIYVVNGRPGMMVELASGVVRNSGKAVGLKMGVSGEGDARHGWCESRRDGDTLKTSFSVSDAKKAGLWGGGTWAKYPDRMLQARAAGYHYRDYYSDVLMGLNTVEELEDTPSETRRVVSTEVMPASPDPLAETILSDQKIKPRKKRAASLPEQSADTPQIADDVVSAQPDNPIQATETEGVEEPLVIETESALLAEADDATRKLWPSSKLMRDKACRILFDVESHAIGTANRAQLVAGVKRLRRYVESIGDGKPAITPAELEDALIPF